MKEIELKKVKLLLDDMLDFLAEIPVDRYHDYRDFRNLRFRGHLINKFMRERYAWSVKRMTDARANQHKNRVTSRM